MKRSSSILQPIFRVIILASVGWLLTDCNSETKVKTEAKTGFDLSKAEWLIGSWEAAEDTGTSVETWVTLNDSTYKGISYLINAEDTIIIEKLSLSQHGDSLYYTAIVTGQNGGLPIKFVVTQLSDSNMVIENPAHDFPKLISYYTKPIDSLIAIVSGTYDGKDVSIRIPMKKAR